MLASAARSVYPGAALTRAIVFDHPIARLRMVGLVEGISFLVLLGIAMPLKYLAGVPLAVKLVGWAHGVLFIAFCVALQQAHQRAGWSLGRTAVFFGAALVPFGPFVIDRTLRQELAASAAK